MASSEIAPSSVIEQNCFNGWETYPANVDARHPLLSSAVRSSNRLTSTASKLFANAIDVQVIGVGADESVTLDTRRCELANSLEDVLKRDAVNPPRIRIISLHSKRTPAPLKITEVMMRKLLTAYKIGPEFLNVLYSFGQAPNLAESGSKNLTCHTRSDGSKDVSYQLRYAEENQRHGIQPWSLRQMGVYHHQSAIRPFDLFIVLNCSDSSTVEKQLLNLATSSAARRKLLDDPCHFHLLPLSTHVDDWRWYLRHLGDLFFDQNEHVMTLELRLKGAEVNFDKVQGLRNLKDIILPFVEYFTATVGIINGLQAFHTGHFDCEWSLTPYEERINDFSGDISSLMQRIDNSIDTASYFLELKNQDTAANINETMSEVTRKTNNDTTSVRWITLLTLIYLPASFTSALYGMNFFVFDSDTSQLGISRDFWIYIATLMPLTLATFLAYRMLKVYNDLADEKVHSHRTRIFWKQVFWPSAEWLPNSTEDFELPSCRQTYGG